MINFDAVSSVLLAIFPRCLIVLEDHGAFYVMLFVLNDDGVEIIIPKRGVDPLLLSYFLDNYLASYIMRFYFKLIITLHIVHYVFRRYRPSYQDD